jgi:TetR/AcrR family transcriptional repressor of nem operon
MAKTQHADTAKQGARERILAASIKLIREKGYGATTVDALCAEAGVTKGAFFHHFKSKEALGVEAANYWSETTGALFASADYHALADPLDRVLGYIDLRMELLDGPLPETTCLVGTMAQEIYESSDPIRAACEASIAGHAATLENDFAAAIRQQGIADDITAGSLALHTQVVLQGAFVLAKACGDAAVARQSIVHLKRYISLLFKRGDS